MLSGVCSSRRSSLVGLSAPAQQAGDVAIDLWRDGGQPLDELGEIVVVRREPAVTSPPNVLQGANSWFHGLKSRAKIARTF